MRSNKSNFYFVIHDALESDSTSANHAVITYSCAVISSTHHGTILFPRAGI
jgi:hypothetical protein